MKAFSYLRVSGLSQVEGDGFPRQRQAIAKYAGSNNIIVLHEFRDEGVSGTKELQDREGLTELLASLNAEGVRLVLVERADRLARDSVVAELLLREFENLGVKVVEAEGGNDLTVIGEDNPTRKLVRQILAAVSEFDKSSLVMRMKAGKIRTKKEKGRCEGQKPFGHYPGEGETLSRMKAMKGSGETVRKIAAKLNAEGVPTRHQGGRWTFQFVAKVLSR